MPLFLRPGTEKTIEKFEEAIRPLGLAGKAIVDHICYKCVDSNEYNFHFDYLGDPNPNKNCSRFLFQSVISGRRVAYVGLKDPIKTSLGEINYLELSDYKEDDTNHFWDHIEIYSIISTDKMWLTLPQYLMKIRPDLQKKERPHHTTFDLVLFEKFKLRITDEPLVDKIKREEFR